MTHRVTIFVVVGALGFLLQIATLTLLTMAGGCPYGAATAIAVGLTMVHNFYWHDRWTWRDRTVGRHGRTHRLLKYSATTGLTSVGGHLLVTMACVELLGFPILAANIAGVAAMAFVNFTMADRWVFARRMALTALALLAIAPRPAAAGDAEPETVAAWNRYVAAAGARLHKDRQGAGPEGGAIEIPGGTIHHWHGSTIVRRTTVDQVVRALMYPGTPPPQEDVLESRVLSRTDNSLHVYLKLTRTAIVTVVYDTEHDVVFQRHSASLATSRSVSTKIAEVDGGDRGFLWRLNSYWRYTQVGSDVRIELESLSLSREVPWVTRPIANPIANRIARESMIRTLSSVRRFLETARRT
jgi:putative flippase GtrA